MHKSATFNVMESTDARSSFYGTEVHALPGFYIEDGEVHVAERAIRAAKRSHAAPSQSGYHVRAVGVTRDGAHVHGGNMEYGHNDAFIHGESAVVSNALAQHGEVDLKTLAFYNEALSPEDLVVYPCGNCRDILQEYVSPDMLVVAGNESIIKLGRFASYLHDEYEEGPRSSRLDSFDELEAAVVGLEAAVTAYAPTDVARNVYSAVLTTHSTLTAGAHYTGPHYRSLTAGEQAVTKYQFSQPEQDLQQAVFATYGTADELPEVFYRDRQALLDLDDTLQLVTGRKEPLPVVLLTLDRETRKIVNAARTDSSSWLPYPFKATAFGMEAAVEQIARTNFSRIKS